MDLRYAVRSFRRNPGFTIAALLSVAIGIGANTSMFSVTSALLLHPLPYRDAERLVILWNSSPGLDIAQDWFSTGQYFDIRNGHRGFEDAAIAIGANYNLTGIAEPERIGTIEISSNLLPMLGAQALAGRLFTSADNVPGAPPAAILNYGTWTRRFGGDPGAVGRSLTLNGKLYTIVGVLPRWFSLPQEVLPTLGRAEDAEILLPLPLDASDVAQRGREDYNVIAKLRPGVPVRQAQAEMDALTARLRRDYPELYPPNGGLTFRIVPLLEQVVGDSRRTLWMLLASVGFVLLIACSNVANLLLSRAVARQKEIAVRAAMGAGRGRIVRQLLTESVLLALGGGALGVLLAFWSVRWIRAMGVRSVPRLGEIAVNGEVLLFTLALSVAAGILFGLAPAWRAGRLDLHANLKDAGRSAGTGAVWGRGNRLRRLLVVSELALSVVLLIGAGLLLRSFARLQAVAPGFNPKNVLTLELTMSGRRYNNGASVIRGYQDILERIDRIPGVAASGAVSALPLSQMFSWGPLWVEGRVRPPGEKFLNADVRITYGRYFPAMEIPLLAGRFFDEHDIQSNPHVAIVDDLMARQLWPGESALGKRMRIGGAESKSPLITVVGVVGRVKQYALDADSRIAYYLPLAQYPAREMNLVARGGTLTAVRRQIREMDPDLPVYRVKMMTERVAESLARRRFTLVLLGIFAALALVLAAIGIYGVMAYLVTQGTRELGIRIALGATGRGILGLVLGRGMAVAAAGVGLGAAGALLLTRSIRTLLFEVPPTDILTFSTVPLLLIAVAVAASYLPARRAAKIDPMVSLRHD